MLFDLLDHSEIHQAGGEQVRCFNMVDIAFLLFSRNIMYWLECED